MSPTKLYIMKSINVYLMTVEIFFYKKDCILSCSASLVKEVN